MIAHLFVATSAIAALLSTWMFLHLFTRETLDVYAAPTRRAQLRAGLTLMSATVLFCVQFAGVLVALVDRFC